MLQLRAAHCCNVRGSRPGNNPMEVSLKLLVLSLSFKYGHGSQSIRFSQPVCISTAEPPNLRGPEPCGLIVEGPWVQSIAAMLCVTLVAFARSRVRCWGEGLQNLKGVHQLCLWDRRAQKPWRQHAGLLVQTIPRRDLYLQENP